MPESRGGGRPASEDAMRRPPRPRIRPREKAVVRPPENRTEQDAKDEGQS